MSGEEPESERLTAIPGAARVAASAGLHTAGWAAGISLRATRRLIEVALDPGKAGDLARDIRETTRDAARDIVGMTDIEERLQSVPGTEVARRVVDAVPSAMSRNAASKPGLDGRNADPLRVRGEELLYRSRDVHYDEATHPAYERLLDSLSPDEARILRLMLLDGPQPSVDVRTGGPLGLLSSRLIAPGCNMIGARAGLRYVERTPEYLQNLNRLGLIWFSRETIRDPLKYQVLEAQPEVLEAIHSIHYAKIVRRSIHLTPFGEGFCRATLMPDEGRPEHLPEHAAPKVRVRDPQLPESDSLELSTEDGP